MGVDLLLRRNRDEARLRSAWRLRLLIERMGGPLIKVGQQASLRSDLLPEEYCDQLEKLLDRLPAFPVSEAYRAIEEQTGRPLAATFATFCPEPVGSASVACVYRAFLHNGDEVAVKVRRPGIRKEFETDLAVMDLVAAFLEFLTVVRPGISESFRTEARSMLLEELDFRSEARYQELFTRYHRRRKKLKIRAPKVYHDLSGREVIVSEYVSGIWVKEIMAKMQEQDEGYLAFLDGLGINPRRVAKRLIRSQHYQFHECPFFHGDPHPGNILVQPGGKIVMVDFGACGVFAQKDRDLMLRMNYHYTRGDVAGMVQCVIGLMEPVPRIDVDEFSKYLQDEWWKGYYGVISKHADWSERTSFRLWVALLRAFRRFGVAMPLHMIRMIRATLLYDTVAAHLYSKINVFKEFEKYQKDVARRTRRHMEASVIRQVLMGPDDSHFLMFKRLVDLGNALFFRLQKFLGESEVGFQGVVNKVYYLIDAVVDLFKTAVMMTAASFVVGVVLMLIREGMWRALGVPHRHMSWNPITWHVMPTDPAPDRMLQGVAMIWLFILAMTVLSYARRTLFAFETKDTYSYEHRIG